MKWLDETEPRMSGLQGMEDEQKLQVNETFFSLVQSEGCVWALGTDILWFMSILLMISWEEVCSE